MKRNFTNKETSVNSRSRHLSALNRWMAAARLHLRKWSGSGERGVHRHFLNGAAQKLGSGAVTLLILWWETRR
ncbi:hypothetical protein ACIPJQ_39010 [Streptomyces griseoviridis]